MPRQYSCLDRRGGLAAQLLGPRSIVGDREASAGRLRVVADQGFAPSSGQEAMLQGVEALTDEAIPPIMRTETKKHLKAARVLASVCLLPNSNGAV